MNNFNSRNRRDTLRLYAAISLTALLGSISIGVSAQEATPDDWTKVEVTRSRAEVHAEAVEAVKAAFSAAPALEAEPSTLTRAQVAAEAKVAVRLGLTQTGEGPGREQTEAELALIHQAGLVASRTSVALAY